MKPDLYGRIAGAVHDVTAPLDLDKSDKDAVKRIQDHIQKERDVVQEQRGRTLFTAILNEREEACKDMLATYGPALLLITPHAYEALRTYLLKSPHLLYATVKPGCVAVNELDLIETISAPVYRQLPTGGWFFGMRVMVTELLLEGLGDFVVCFTKKDKVPA